MLERTAYGAKFQSKYYPNGAAETKKEKRGALQKTHIRCTVAHGHALKAVGTHGLEHSRALARA